jgi:phage terminase large subunit
MQIEIPKQNFNDIYLPYLYEHTGLQIYYGGAASGKSYFIAQKIIVNLMCSPGFNVMVLRAVGATNHDSTFAQLSQLIHEWDIEKLFKINRSHGGEMIECINGNQVIFKGLDNVEKIKSTTFKTGPLTTIWIEEANEIKETDFNQLEFRLRGKTKVPKSIIISFNPIDQEHWIKARFFDIAQDPENSLILKTTYLDNKFLDESDKKRILKYKEIDEYYYQVYALGNWGTISGARVFHNIIIEEFSYTEADLQNVSHGMDFGYIHANTLMSCGFRENDLYIFKEYYYKELTNTQFLGKINESGWDKKKVIIADSAEPAYIAEFKEDGYIYMRGAKKPKGSLENGIDYLKNFKIHIHKINCPNAAREFPGFKQRELRDGTITKDFVELDDDTIAGVRYAVEHLWINRNSQQKPSDIGKDALFGKKINVSHGVSSNKFVKNHEEA